MVPWVLFWFQFTFKTLPFSKDAVEEGLSYVIYTKEY